MFSSPGFEPARIAPFWDAVAQASESFVTDMFAQDPPRATAEFDQVANLLQRVHPGLLLTVGVPTAARPHLVISAGGVRDLFPFVMRVVDGAPPRVLDRFDVKAFRPREVDPSGIRMKFKGREVGPGDIRWTATKNRHEATVADVTLYIPGWIEALPADSPANETAATSVFLLLDHLLGEFTVVTQVGAIEWRAMSEAAAQYPTLLDLPAHLDRLAAH